MGEAQAQQIVLGVVIVSGAILVYDNIKKTGKASPTGKQLVSFVILAGGLAVGASVAPSVVGPLALLIGVAFAISRVSPGKATAPAPFHPGTN